MIIISLSQAKELADRNHLNCELEFADIERIMLRIGNKIAADYGVVCHAADIQDEAFGGACILFTAGHENQECPQGLQELDPGGELPGTIEPMPNARLDRNCSTLTVFEDTSCRTYICDGCGKKDKTVCHCNVVVARPDGYDFWLCKECRRQCAMTAQPGDGARPIPDGRQMVTKVRELVSGGIPLKRPNAEAQI